ncbi:MAG: recombinase family protein [Pseudomonadota bacterium]
MAGGKSFSRGALYCLLRNPLYTGKIAHKGTHHDGQHAAIVDTELWEQAQRKLIENRNCNKTKTLAKDPSLLAGLLFDDRNNPMSPTHATKQNRRYRYYISQAVLQYKESDKGSVIRTPAKPIEEAVSGQVKRLLSASNELLQAVIPNKLSANHQKALLSRARTLADTWDCMKSHKQHDFLNQVILKITLGQNEMVIEFSRTALACTLLEDILTKESRLSFTDDEYRVTVPVKLKRCGIETKLIIPGKEQPGAHERTVHAIQGSLRKALNWNQALISGEAASMADLAKAEGVSKRYITQIIKLAYLAPDIMGAIIKGNIPATLTLTRLKGDIPLNWNKQRNQFNFSITPAA